MAEYYTSAESSFRQEVLEVFVENSSDLLFVLDQQYNVVVLNKAARMLYNNEGVLVKNTPFMNLLDPDSRGKTVDALKHSSPLQPVITIPLLLSTPLNTNMVGEATIKALFDEEGVPSLFILVMTCTDKLLDQDDNPLQIRDQDSQLYNSAYFYHRLHETVALSLRKTSHVSLLLFRIDHSNHYTEAYGEGERKQIVHKLGEIVLLSIRKTDQAFRLDENTFAMILPDLDNGKAQIFANRLKRDFSHHPFILHNLADETVQVYKTISIGIAEFDHTEKALDLLRNALDAVAIASNNGGDQIKVLSTSYSD